MRTLLLVSALLPSLACAEVLDSCLRPPSIVDDVRILAVRADPPDQLVDLLGTAAPTVRVRALVGGHGNQRPVRLGGFLCIPTDDLRCPEGSMAVAVGEEALGPEAEVTFTVPLSLIAAARDADPLRGYGGIRVQLDAIATVEGQPFHAGKVLLFQTDAAVTPNGAIEVASVDVTSQPHAYPDGTFDPRVTQIGTPSAEVDVVYGETYDVRPRIIAGPGAAQPAERFTTVDLSGRTVTLTEVISYSFFTTEELIFGDFPGGLLHAAYRLGADVADEPRDGSPDPPHGLVRLTVLVAGAYSARLTTNLWVVARDGRGAVAWTWATVRIAACPQCWDARITCEATTPHGRQSALRR